MKNLIFASALLLVTAPLQSKSAPKWANCPSFHGVSIQEVFWKSDVDGGNGPDYQLKSGQMLSNAGSVCQPGSVLKSEEWAQTLKTGLSPVKTINAFKSIKSPEEFQKFLKEFGVAVDDQERLNQAVKAYLAGKPLESSEPGPTELISNPAILVGKSNQQALIALVKSDGKYRSATLIALKQRASEQ